MSWGSELARGPGERSSRGRRRIATPTPQPPRPQTGSTHRLRLRAGSCWLQEREEASQSGHGQECRRPCRAGRWGLPAGPPDSGHRGREGEEQGWDFLSGSALMGRGLYGTEQGPARSP